MAFLVNGKTIAKARFTDLVKLKPEEIAKLTKTESISLEKRFRREAQRRLKNIEKAGLYSGAFEKTFGDELPKTSSKSSTRQSIQHHIAQYRSFFGAKSSSLTGIKKIQKAQEERIFGKKGGFSDEDESRRFWKAYNEFMHQNPRFYDNSEKIQAMLGEMSFWKYRGFNSNDLSDLLEKAEKKLYGGGDFRADVGY